MPISQGFGGRRRKFVTNNDSMTDYLDTKLRDIRDGDILTLNEELEAICGVRAYTYRDQTLRMFLRQCVYPNGTGTKRVPLSTRAIVATVLEYRVGKLPCGPLFDLCQELAIPAGKSREDVLGWKVVLLLNRTIPKCAVTKPLTERQRREQRIVQWRRT
jgi:hypothetical protein